MDNILEAPSPTWGPLSKSGSDPPAEKLGMAGVDLLAMDLEGGN